MANCSCEESSYVSETEEPGPVKKIYKQKYNHTWEKNVELKGWISGVKGNRHIVVLVELS